MKPLFETGSAEFSDCRRYRYRLTRLAFPTTNASLRRMVAMKAPAMLLRIVFVMLNPSSADEHTDDPTIRRCIGFAETLGFNRVDVVNLFAMVATDPRDLWSTPVLEAVGPENDQWLLATCLQPASFVVCAWGAQPRAAERAASVRHMLRMKGVVLHHLGLTSAGDPRHPLYLPKTATPEEW